MLLSRNKVYYVIIVLSLCVDQNCYLHEMLLCALRAISFAAKLLQQQWRAGALKA